MDNKKKSPYGKILLVLMTVLFAAGLTAPLVTGYVNNASLDTNRDKDIQMSIILENVISRMVRNGDISLSKGLSSDLVEMKISGFMGKVPTVNQQGYSFCMNISNGVVDVKKEKEPDEIVINSVKGD